jgi:hypothetical protein
MLLTLMLLLAQSPQTAPAPKPNAPKPQATVPKPEGKHETIISSQSPQVLAKRIVGKWEQDASDESGLGVMLTLNPDGTATVASGIVEDLNYNFDGQKLIVVDADDPDQVKQVSTIVLTGNVMKETNDDTQQSAEFVRVAGAPANVNTSLVGEWKRRVENLPLDPTMSDADRTKRLQVAENGRYYYKPDGRLFVRIPLSMQKGTWDLASDGTLRLEFSGNTRDSKISFVNGDLVLTTASGNETYHRSQI